MAIEPDARTLPAGITDLIPEISEDLRVLLPAPKPATTEEILAQRTKYRGLPGFEATDYGKQALDDRRLTLALMGLSAAERGFGGMGTPPIPGEMAFSTFGRGVLGPLAGDIKPIAADFYGRKTQRAAAQKAEAAGLTQAAITTLEQRNAAAALQNDKIAEMAADLAKDQYGKFQEAKMAQQNFAHNIYMAGLAHTSKVEIADLTAGHATTAAELLGDRKIEQIRETATHAGERLQEEINSREGIARQERGVRVRLHQEKLAATSDENEKERVSREFQAGEQRRAEEHRLAIKQKFDSEQRGLQNRFTAVENQFTRAQEKELALAREAGQASRHAEDIKTRLDVSGLDRASRESLQEKSLRAGSELNRINNAHSDAVAEKNRLSADMNERIRAMEAYNLAASKAEWSGENALELQELKNEWKERTFDYYDKGTTQKVHLTPYGATQMGFGPDAVEGLKGRDFDLTYYYPKPGFASEVVKPYVVISGGGKSFNSLQYDPETGGGKNVVVDPTLMVTGRGEAEGNKLYENTSDVEIKLPLGGANRKVAPGAGVMLTNWEHQYMDEAFKKVLIETDSTTLARHRAREDGIRSAWEQALGRDEAGLNEAQMDLSLTIPRYEGGRPLFEEFSRLMHAATGIRGKMDIKEAREEATEFINALKNSAAWRNQTLDRQKRGEIDAEQAALLSPQDASPEDFFEGLRVRDLVAGERPWDQLSMLEQRAFEALPRGLPEGYNKRVITQNWEKQITRLEDIRAKYDDSLATPQGIQAATSLATVKGLLEILHNEPALLNRTGKFWRGLISQTRQMGADVPLLGSPVQSYLAKIFADLQTNVNALAKAQGVEGRNFVTEFSTENLRDLLPKINQQEAKNRSNVESALRLVTNAMEAYGSPQVQEGFIIPEEVAATFLAMGVDINLDIEKRYPFMKATNPDPLVTMKDLDPEGVIRRVLTPRIWEQIREGQKIDYEIDGKYGWYKTGPNTVRHPDDPEDLEDKPLVFKAKGE